MRRIKKEGGEWGWEYKKLKKKVADKVEAITNKKHDVQQNKQEQHCRHRLYTNPSTAEFWRYVRYGKRGDTDITLAQNDQGVTVATKSEIKEAFYDEFRQRFEGSERPIGQDPVTKSRPGEIGEGVGLGRG